ncbi:MAG TPA: SDR family oxidoreductase [Mycoplana sp.]|nr:SDR family oxidoreductase [Mycoplana sp.]
MILVTGATGTSGRELIRHLSKAGAAFKAMVRKEADREALETQGVAAVVADYRDAERLTRALIGVEQVYLIGPTDPPQVTHEGDVVEVAHRVGVRRIVKQSAMSAHDMSPCTFKRWNGMVERQLIESGLPYTILRPTGFMQTFVNYDSAGIAAEGVLRSPRREAQVSWIDVRDIAAVAVAVLTEEGHDGRVYDLTGPEALSDQQVAAKLSAATGREIRYEPLSDADWYLLMRSRGLPATTVRSMLSLHLAYRAESPGLVTGWVEVLSGQPPRTFDDFAQEHADRFKGPEAA